MTPTLPDEWILSEVRDHSGQRVGFMRKKNMPDTLPDGRHRKRAWLTLYFVPQGDCMPSQADLENFQRIEDELATGLEETHLAEMVAVVTLEGKRDHLFYFTDQDRFVEAISAVTRSHLGYRPELETADDPGWEELRNMMG
ncbi:MAG TPA: DUF695 domain-containing protein [Fimbriimonadaceae bacterium]|nr:DUF695 domain-containing protein [Fimbriimonadaceae bacterium]